MTSPQIGMAGQLCHQERFRRERNRRRGFHQNRQRFTLVEMLVVISIIALLAALLMPALSKACAQAEQAMCANNLRLTCTALMMYADCSEGIIRTRGAESTGGWEGACFYATLYPKTNKGPEPFWYCPSIPNRIKETLVLRQSKKTYATFVSTESNATSLQYFLRIRKVRQPSVFPFTLDSLGTDGRMNSLIWDALQGYIGMLHSEGSNVCFLDGHVQKLDFGQWQTLPSLLTNCITPNKPKVLYRANYTTAIPLF